MIMTAKPDLKVIEFVCTHNHGRSPLAEAIATAELERIGNNDYDVRSSGSDVDRINAMLLGETPIPDEDVRYILNLANKRDDLDIERTPKELLDLLDDGSISDKERKYIQDLSHELMVKFVLEEHSYRGRFFSQIGLGFPKEHHDMLVAGDDRILVLGMGRSHVDAIRRVYDGRENQPIIETLAGYATGESGAEFESGYGGTQEDYNRMGSKIFELVNASIRRLTSD